MSESHFIITLMISISISACYEELSPPPQCFESSGDIRSIDNMKIRDQQYANRSANHCAVGSFTCLEAWTGMNQTQLSQNKEYYSLYPYLSLIKSDRLSEDSLFSICSLPAQCELPTCECEHTRDCQDTEVCVGRGFIGSGDQIPLTECLPICNPNGSCADEDAKTYCSIEHCFVP